MAPSRTQVQFSFEDTDGDVIEFRVTTAGRLQQFVNGELELAHVRTLNYRIADALIQDDTGDFNFRKADQANKAAVLRTLAVHAGVTWRGDEPAAATELQFVDTEGDVIEFRLSTSGKLQEYVNGDLEISEVHELTYSSKEGMIIDDDGEFQLKPEDRLENAVLLRALAFRAGVVWRGDEPLPMTINFRRLLSSMKAVSLANATVLLKPAETQRPKASVGLPKNRGHSAFESYCKQSGSNDDTEMPASDVEVFQMDDCDSERSWELVSESGSNESWEVLAVKSRDGAAEADERTEWYAMSDSEDEENGIYVCAAY